MIYRRIPFNATHKGVYEALSAHQDAKVYDRQPDPEEAEYPCIVIGPFSFKANGTKVINIPEVSLQLHIWSTDTSKAEIEEICNDVSIVLSTCPLDMSGTGFECLGQDIDQAEIFEEDEDAFHAVLTFVAQIQQKA